MTTREWRLEGTLSGTGEVYREEERVGNVAYSLRVERQYLLQDTPDGRVEEAGILRILGTITVPQVRPDVFGGRDVLTLHLQDGRTWEFVVEGGEPTGRELQVGGASGEAFRPG